MIGKDEIFTVCHVAKQPETVEKRVLKSLSALESGQLEKNKANLVKYYEASDVRVNED